ncbi:hypothetical protein H0H81_009767 [Sphagnurus paluster]|uniref:Uncharacterized protein n=1 Tax=Sphagnurus paluster TaxID=117069 RepID=A0A9P7FRZ0_9AGAR|nr:hypothetical protein H0H81_009767 [Sphagnurus paluster]
MAGSAISSDSLSSPSPSPSPPPETHKLNEPTSAGLDSDSELSELTEEEQETDKRDSSPRKGARNGAARRGRRPSRRGGRRKTSSIVPAPMWGWAETRSSSNVVEEEEEEEVAEPPRAMEEEEEDEEPVDEEDEGEEPVAPKTTSEVPTVDDDEDRESLWEPSHRTRRSLRKSNFEPSDNGSEKNALTLDDDVDVEAEEGDDASDNEAAPAKVDDPGPESENETESEDEVDSRRVPATADEPPHLPMEVDVDQAAPQPQDIPVVVVPSIISNATLVTPPSASSSARSTPASSRSPSPAPGVSPDDATTKAIVNEHASTIQPAIDMDVEVPEQDIADEQEPDVDDGEQDDVNPDDDGDMEVESDLQPAHRAEALDVLATIELKFALLRERVYVEKMETLAWEETLVNEGTHPELIHLQQELSRRRDKRLDLAAGKRDYEIKNVNKRRRSDEDATWSWWKRQTAREDVWSESEGLLSAHSPVWQTIFIETVSPNLTYHFEVRRIPALPQDLPPPPPLRKIIKSFPFALTQRHSKQRGPQPLLVYPDLSALPSADIDSDLEFLFQARIERERSRGSGPLGYDMHVHRPNMGVNHNGAHIGGPGMGMPPGPHPLGYEGYKEGVAIGGPRPFSGPPAQDHRMPQVPPFQPPPPPHHHHHGLPPPPSQQGPPPMPHSAFAGPPGSRNVHMQQHNPPPPGMQHNPHHAHGPPPPPPPQHHSGYAVEPHQKEMPPGASIHHPHAYFAPGHGLRRSPSPVGILPNGSGGGAKMNGSWMGAGMGMERVYPGKGSEWGRERPISEEEDRERVLRERDRDKREREQRDREREREREREHPDVERERQREREREREREMHHAHQHQQQMQHRHPPAPQHMHMHSGPPGGQPPHHHMNPPHHHHRPHHHHVLHHHHQPPSGPSNHTSMPPSGPLRSPRSSQQREREREREREFDGRPPHPNHSQHPTEVINLTSSKSAPTPGHPYHDQHPSQDYRDVRSKHGPSGSRIPPSGPGSSMIMDDRDRPIAMPFALPPSHGMSPPNHIPAPGSNQMNGKASPRSGWNPPEESNFRMPPHSSGPPPSGQPPPPGYHGPPHEGGPHSRSPSHRYTSGSSSSHGRGPPPPMPSSQQPSRQNSTGLHSPPRPTLPRPPVPPAPPSPSMSSAPLPYPSNPNPNRSPARFGPPPPPQPTAPARSPPISLKMRPPSPLTNKMLAGPSGYSALSGPGRTSTPTLDGAKNGAGGPYPPSGGGRTTSPHVPFPAPTAPRSYMGANSVGDRERERLASPHLGPPPPPPPSKMSVPQMVDGH